MTWTTVKGISKESIKYIEKIKNNFVRIKQVEKDLLDFKYLLITIATDLQLLDLTLYENGENQDLNYGEQIDLILGQIPHGHQSKLLETLFINKEKYIKSIEPKINSLINMIEGDYRTQGGKRRTRRHRRSKRKRSTRRR